MGNRLSACNSTYTLRETRMQADDKSGVPWVRLPLVALVMIFSTLGMERADTLFRNPLVKVGSTPTAIANGDFNGDGQMDFAVTNSSSNDISILMGGGDGTFAPEVRVGAGSGPSSIAVADMNRDGRLDLVVAGVSGVSV